MPSDRRPWWRPADVHTTLAEVAGAVVGSVTTLVGTAMERRWTERRLRVQAAELAREEAQRKLDDTLKQVLRRLDRLEGAA